MVMKKLLLISSSPRGARSSSSGLASAFVEALQAQDPAWTMDRCDLWKETLPAMTGSALTAKYAVLTGQALSEEQEAAWSLISTVVDRFRSADAVLIAAPMWNFGVPYPLKHYVDVITQPGLVFSWTPQDGYQSLLTPRPAIVVSSSAGDYSVGSGNESRDYLRPFLTDWLQVYMGCTVHFVSCAPTVAAPEAVEAVAQAARAQLAELAEQLA